MSARNLGTDPVFHGCRMVSIPVAARSQTDRCSRPTPAGLADATRNGYIVRVCCGTGAVFSGSAPAGAESRANNTGAKRASMKTALITGITGQDGMYLTEHLLSLGYRVCGLIRGQNNPKRERLEVLFPDLELVDGDLLDQGSLISAVQRVQPDEVYNLAAISFVPVSWNQAELTGDITGLGVLRMLEAVRIVEGVTSPNGGTRAGRVRCYQASSSEMFGKVRETPQSERTPFYPRSPYGVAKVYGHYITVNYRESYG